MFFFSFAHKLSLGSFGHLSPFDRRAESRLIWHRTGRASPAKRTRLNSAPDVIGDGEARGSLLIISIPHHQYPPSSVSGEPHAAQRHTASHRPAASPACATPSPARFRVSCRSDHGGCVRRPAGAVRSRRDQVAHRPALHARRTCNRSCPRMHRCTVRSQMRLRPYACEPARTSVCVSLSTAAAAGTQPDRLQLWS